MNPGTNVPDRSVEVDGYERRRQRTRGAIVDAAQVLIRANGAEFSMRNLAKEAGVSPATPFNQFDTKLGVLSAVVERSLVDIGRTSTRPDPRVSSVDAIIDYVDHVTAHYANDRDLYAPTLGALLSFASLDNPITMRATAMWRVGLRTLETQGELASGLDVEMLARHLESSWIGSLLPWCSDAVTGIEWRRQVRFSTALTLTASTTGASRQRAQSVVAEV